MRTHLPVVKESSGVQRGTRVQRRRGKRRLRGVWCLVTYSDMAPADPLTGARFLVEIDGLSASDFTEVLFPEATIAAGREQLTHLILKRGASVDRQLCEWWKQSALGKPAPKSLSVVLLDERGTPQIRWRCEAAQPVRYALSALNAVTPSVVVETMELSVEGFERG